MSQHLDIETSGFAAADEPSERGSGSRAEPTEPVPDASVLLEPRRRRWPWLLAGVAVGAAGSFALADQRGSDDPADTMVAETVELTTVRVTSQDLVEEVEWAGTLAAGSATTITAPRDGVVTAAAADGSTIERGDTLVEIDDSPLVVLYGDIPMWRDLAVGIDGDDVRQLEANLVHLGYDPDGIVTVDDEFTSATADMVERWQEDLGVDATGRVAVWDVAVLPGPTEVVDEATVGGDARVGTTLVAVESSAERIDVVGSATAEELDDDEDRGEIESIASVGTPIAHGTALYTVGDSTVAAVVDLDDTTERVLDTMASDGIEELETALVDLGFDPDGVIEIDDEVDDGTTAALERWQARAGLPVTGSSAARDFVVVAEAADAPYVVGEVFLEPGDRLGEGAIVMALETPTLQVTADVAVREIDEFVVGDAVVVEQLDETTFEAVVASIADVADPAATPDDVPTLEVTFEVTSEPEEYVDGAVTVITESSRIDDAMVVPSRALVTLREGGFAVEKQLAGGSTELVGVDIGTFDDSMVEILEVTVGTLAIGDEVVVPS